MKEDLISRHRPKKLEDVWGNDGVKKNWRERIKRFDPPHSIILDGKMGVGKTTLARIFCEEIMQCHVFSNKFSNYPIIVTTGKQYKEYDGSMDADYKSLSSFIISTYGLMHAAYVCYMDEAQSLSNKKQESFLKPVEDRENLYLIFSTTQINKIIEPLKQRSVIYPIDEPSMPVLIKEVGCVAKREGLNLLPDALEYLIIKSDRVPRKCVKNLGGLLHYKGPITKEMVEEIYNPGWGSSWGRSEK